MDVATGQIRELAPNAVGSDWAHWNAAGDGLIFELTGGHGRDLDYEIHSARPDGTGDVTLAQGIPGPYSDEMGPRWGYHVAYHP